MNWLKKNWPYLIYISLAIATFKHSSWGYSTVLEGSAPDINFNTLTLNLAGVWAILTLLFWYIWGGLMALATDVGMVFIARSIRERANKESILSQPWGLWVAYLMAASASAYTQFLYGVQHAAPLAVVATKIPSLQTGGFLFWALEYRLLYLPLLLPAMSFIYTVAFKVDDHQQIEKPGKVDKTRNVRILNVSEAALFTNYSEARIRQLAADGKIGIRDENGKWQFTDEELLPIKRS